nr:MAG TPA_asm: apical membrane antigen 1 [Caudoviricetes sp.]
MVLSGIHSIICRRAIHIAVNHGSGIYPTVPEP